MALNTSNSPLITAFKCSNWQILLLLAVTFRTSYTATAKAFIMWCLLLLLPESVKLFLKDCHQRQSSLYSINPTPDSPVSFVLAPLSKGELLYTSGQSRLHLHLREGGSTAAKSDIIDFLIFTKPVTNICKVPKFPTSLDEEATAFRSHGLPLLVWPRNRDKNTVQKVPFTTTFINQFVYVCSVMTVLFL